MTSSVLLDTSFLISLVNAKRNNHDTAKQYYKHILEKKVLMYLSPIVVAEFCVKQPIEELCWNNFIPLPFNVIHGKLAARLFNDLGHRDAGDDRVAVKDDLKLIAQASCENIDFILTDDGSTLYKYCERLRKNNCIQVCSIKLEDGFDSAAFQGQRVLDLGDLG